MKNTLRGIVLQKLLPGRNMLLHGDNGLVLDLLTKTHQGKIKCAYLDPPYNNGEAIYITLTAWGMISGSLNLNRAIRDVKKLLSDDGSLWISIDDSEAHYLKVAADAVFGRKNFASTIVWERRTTRENRTIFLTQSRVHSSLLQEYRCVGEDSKFTPVN